MILSDIKRLNIPTDPGSYQFYDAAGKIIYVGKASNLRSRVFSYWRQSADHSPAKRAMLKKIEKIGWIETDTEIEALLLESNLVKKYQPDFNIALRDDKRFVHIKISADEYPRIYMTRNIGHSGKYFGPFTSSEAVRQTLAVLRKIWPYRSCRAMPAKPCLYYQISKCPGVCQGKMSASEYRKIIKQIILFLEGKKGDLVKEIKNGIKALNRELSRQEDPEKSRFLEKSRYQLDNMENILAHTKILGVGEKYANDVVELAKLLSLPRIPLRIEGYDISNIFGKEAVGSMSVFIEGEAEKNEYRKFKIRNMPEQGNDTAMLKQVLERRFNRIGSEDKKNWPAPDLIVIDGGKGQLNALSAILKRFKLDIPAIAISKGEGLRSAAAPDKLFFPGEKKSLELPLSSPALHLVKRVRDEAHRFAIGYHRRLKSRSMFR